MKKYLITSFTLLAFASTLFGANKAQIVNFFKGKVPPTVSIKVAKIEKLKHLKGYELVSIVMSQGERQQTVRMFAKGDYLFPDVMDLKTGKSIGQEIEAKIQAKELKKAYKVLAKVYKEESKNNIISFGNNVKKPSLLVFTDPECPFCRKELRKVEKRIEENNLRLILISVHGDSAFKKIALTYKHMKNAKNDKEKIKILRKYYDPNVDISKEKVSTDEVNRLKKLARKYFNTKAVKGVPAIINLKELH